MSRRSSLLLLALTLVLAGLAAFAAGWHPDNRIQSWTRDGEGALVLARLEEAYGGDEFVLVRVEHGGCGPALAWADRLGDRLAASPAVARVADPLRLPGTGDANEPAPERLRAALERPLVRELGLASAVHLDLVAALRPDADPLQRAELAQLVDALCREAATEDIPLTAAGHPLLAAALDAEAARVDREFAPLLVVLAIVALAALQRSVALALVTCLPAALASVATRAALHAIDWPSNLVLVAVGPLVFVIVLAASLHYVAAFRRWIDARTPAPLAARAGLRDVGRATVLAALTTAIGFGVFGTSDVEAVRRLGIAAALGIGCGTPLAIGCLRALLPGLRTARRHDVHTHALTQLARRAEGRKAWILAGAGLVAVGAVFGVRGLRTGTNALDYFPTAHPLRDAFTRLEATGAGLSAFEVLVEGVPARELAQGSLADALDELDPGRPVFGPELVRRDLEQVAGAAAPYLLGPALVESGRAARVPPEGARWTVFLPTTDAESTRAIADRARALAEAAAPSGTVHLGGSLLGALDMQSALLATLATSLLLTALASGLLFTLVTRRPRLLVAALVVNTFPVAVVAAVNRVTFGGLDASTVMVAAVVLGLAVDNTLHLVFATQHGGPRAAFAKVAEPAALGAAALGLGFASLALSGFAPTAQFGLLVACGVAAAVVGDFVLLPALIVERERGVGASSAAGAETAS